MGVYLDALNSTVRKSVPENEKVSVLAGGAQAFLFDLLRSECIDILNRHGLKLLLAMAVEPGGAGIGANYGAAFGFYQ